MVDIMSAKMQDEIDIEVQRFMSANKQGIRVLAQHEVEQLIRKTLTSGTILGWAHGEAFQRERMQRQLDQLEYEMKCIKDRLKDAEMELLAVQK
jgi:hypothetical protein